MSTGLSTTAVGTVPGDASPETPSAEERPASPEDVQNILDSARQNEVPIKRVESSEDFRWDPMATRQAFGERSDNNGVNVVQSFINRTVFFDYFRHVAHKRFPELPPEARVHALTDSENAFYQRSIKSDYVMKMITTYATLILAAAVVVKALLP